MARQVGANDAANGHTEEMRAAAAEEGPSPAEPGIGADGVIAGAATVGVICVAAALVEAALIPGMIIGVAAMLAPKALPRVGAAVEPAFRGTVRGVYKFGQKARHAMAEAQEQVRDIVAEEQQGQNKASANA